MKKNLSIVILGAGRGTRMNSSTPKILHKIGDKTIISLIIREAKKLTNDIFVIVAYKSNLVKESINREFSDIKFILQDDINFSGTAGGLRNFKDFQENILILNGDMPLIESNQLNKLFNITGDIILGSLTLKNPKGYGRIIEQNNQVLKIVEEKDATLLEKQITSVNAGIYLIKKKILEKHIFNISNNNASKEYYLTDIIELTVSNGGTVKSVELPQESVIGINNRKQLAEAEEIYLNRIKEKLMLQNVTIHLPNTVFISSEVQFIGESEIEQNVTIIGKSIIKNSIIKAGTVIENSYIENSTIGVMAHIRPNSKIINSTIGNFVEIKKSELSGTKSGHLAYIGDSTIGEGTNIGAGVITCNYDGKYKYKTQIGKNVFIGSDSQLIAPLTIDDNVIIGAGSTITNNVPKGSLAISRIKMKIINGFFNRFFNKDN